MHSHTTVEKITSGSPLLQILRTKRSELRSTCVRSALMRNASGEGPSKCRCKFGADELPDCKLHSVTYTTTPELKMHQEAPPKRENDGIFAKNIEEDDESQEHRLHIHTTLEKIYFRVAFRCRFHVRRDLLYDPHDSAPVRNTSGEGHSECCSLKKELTGCPGLLTRFPGRHQLSKYAKYKRPSRKNMKFKAFLLEHKKEENLKI